MNWRPPSGAFCLKAEACRLHNRDDVVPGMIGAIQTHGELLHWHPHIHVLITCGAFTPEGDFLEFPEFDMERLLVAWQDAVFELYLAEEKIEAEVVENMRSWEHSGFSVDQSVFLPAGDQAGKDQSQLTFLSRPSRRNPRGNRKMASCLSARFRRTHLVNQDYHQAVGDVSHGTPHRAQVRVVLSPGGGNGFTG
jgi:hypothetical protein